MSAICIIPARGGSRRIPGKNFKDFLGKPMLVRAIETARASGLFDAIAVSSDSDQAMQLAWSANAAFLRRSSEMCDNAIGTQEIMRYHLNGMATAEPDLAAEEYDYACCLYPCSPLLLPSDLAGAFHALLVLKPTYILSVGSDPLCDAGNFYMGDSKIFREGIPLLGMYTGMWPLPPERTCDINTEEDWARAEKLYEEMHK